MRTGWYEGQQVEIIRKGQKNTRIKLPDGAEVKVPKEKLSETPPNELPPAAPAAVETAPAPIPEPSFASLMGSETVVEAPAEENPQPEQHTVQAPPEELVEAPAPIPEVHTPIQEIPHPPLAPSQSPFPAPIAAPPLPAPAPAPVPEDRNIDGTPFVGVEGSPQSAVPVAPASPDNIPIPEEPPTLPPIPVASQPRRNSLPQNPPARRRVLGAALQSRKINRPQPTNPAGPFPSHPKKLGNEAD